MSHANRPSTALVIRTEAIAQAVEADSPLALLPPQLAPHVECLERTWSDPSYGFDFAFVGYRLPSWLGPEEAAELLRKLEAALPPATPLEIAEALSRVRVLTRARSLDEADAQLTVAAFIEQLSEYPGKLVLETLRYWPRRSPWFPVWEELQDLLKLRGGRTLALFTALRERARQGSPVSEAVSDLTVALRMER